MTETDDTAQAPSEGNTAQGTPAPATPGTPAVDLNAILSRNKELEQERDKLAKNYQEVRRVYTQTSQAKAELERRLQERGEVDFGAQADSRSFSADAEVLADLAEVKFKQNTPDWNKVVDKSSGKTVWDEMNTILFDDAQANELAGRTPYLTLKNIYREVQNRRMSAQIREQQASNPRRNQMLAQAEMSGQGANTPIPTIDISDPSLTEGQLLDAADKAGMLDGLVDPNDPPSWMRK